MSKDLDPEAFKAGLEARQAELLQLGESSAEGRRPVELDQTRVGRLSRMDALQDQAMSLETERRRQIELKRIAAALRRVAEGEYGACVQCGEDISIKRLELDPTAPLCIDCAEFA